jgi:hypothetical protein
MSDQANDVRPPALDDILATIRYLSETIGGRGSCTQGERQACAYIFSRLHSLGLQEINIEPFKAIPSTYWPYALSLATALTGSLVVLIYGSHEIPIMAAILNTFGLLGMLAETEFAFNWTHWFVGKAKSQNIVSKIPAKNPARKQVILCAHLDTHRTPIFYSSNLWYAAFSTLIGLAFLSMLVGAVFFGLGALLAWTWLRWLSAVIVPIQTFAVVMCLHADLTPHSPGANDNASGVAVCLALATHLCEQPLQHTEVHLAFTGCEEVGDYGISEYLDAHSAELGQEALYIVLDEIGLGQIKFLTADGLLLKHRTHPRALKVARQVVQAHPELGAIEGIGMAYTDALRITKRGLAALTLCTVPAPKSGVESHWHRMTDTLEHVDPDDLNRSYQFTRHLLEQIDQSNEQ